MKTFFKDDKLYIYKKDGLTIVRLNPPRALFKPKGKNIWLNKRMFILYPERRIGESPRYDCFLFNLKERRFIKPRRIQMATFLFNSVPEKYLLLIAPYIYRQWHLLSCLSRIKNFDEFLESSPGIGWLLASLWVFHKTTNPFRSIKKLMYKKRKEILNYLGFPSKDSIVRIIDNKIPKEIFCISLFLLLRNLVKNEEILKIMYYLEKINVNVLGILSQQEFIKYCNMNFLIEVSSNPRLNPYDNEILQLFKDTIYMANLLEKKIKVRSIDHLYTIHNELDDLLLEIGFEKVDEGFPEPPIPGIKGIIEPLQSIQALLAESREMKHCVHTYYKKILEGKSYCYRVLYPQRCTLELYENPFGLWKIEQIRGERNSEVGEKVKDMVWVWISNWFKYEILSIHKLDKEKECLETQSILKNLNLFEDS